MPGILPRGPLDASLKLSSQGTGSELVSVPSIKGKTKSAFPSSEGTGLLSHMSISFLCFEVY